SADGRKFHGLWSKPSRAWITFLRSSCLMAAPSRQLWGRQPGYSACRLPRWPRTCRLCSFSATGERSSRRRWHLATAASASRPCPGRTGENFWVETGTASPSLWMRRASPS
ncbi:unnamed protein product, partial [Symbiodinium sp. CCMP2592]